MLARADEPVASDNEQVHTPDSVQSLVARRWPRRLVRWLFPAGLSAALLLGGASLPNQVSTGAGPLRPALAGWLTAPAAAATQRDRRLASRSGVSMVTINRAILAAARRYGVDAALIRAIVRAESQFENGTLSAAGAMGLMQLMPDTARRLGVSDPWDPYQNIMAGTRFLKWLLDEFGSARLAVAAYNAGPGAVRRFGGVPPYAETQRYVEKVLAFRARGG